MSVGMSVVIDSSSAAQLLNRTVKLPGSSDRYVIGLGVFHELHCLVWHSDNSWVEFQLTMMGSGPVATEHLPKPI
jgi:hypothetical protein